MMRSMQKQKGAVLILLFVALIMGAATAFVGALNNSNPQLRDRLNKQNEMQRIKETLLSYAMTFPEYNTTSNGPGRLPCSDTNNDGLMDCTTTGTGLGRLPVRIVPPIGSPVFLSDRYQGTGQQFWYAVAPQFRQNSTTLNTASTSTLTLDGASVAAVIIAPGPALSGQQRINDNQAARYLESTNVGSPNFVTIHPTDPALLNDMISTITVAEILTAATTRTAQEIKRVLGIYYAANGNTYPGTTAQFSAAMTASGAAWIAANAWVATSLETYTNTTVNPVPTSTATVKFTNCAITFTFNSGLTGFTRSRPTC